MFSLLLSVVTKVCSINLEPPSVPLWTEEELESFVTLWLVIFSAWIKTAMFLLYHSEGCNICELVLHECYINDLHTTTCSGMLGHHMAGSLDHKNWAGPQTHPLNNTLANKSFTTIQANTQETLFYLSCCKKFLLALIFELPKSA
jgi:hypothetical protein